VGAVLLPEGPDAELEVINVLPEDLQLTHGELIPAGDSRWDLA
jgi:hypothetical protein